MTMNKTITTPLAALAVIALSSAPALAGDMNKAEKQATKTETVKVVKTIDANNEVGELTIYQPASDTPSSAVLGAVATQNTDAYVVRDDAGNLYINHLIPVNQLPDPTLSVRTVDTFQTEYQGMVFTNRIINVEG